MRNMNASEAAAQGVSQHDHEIFLLHRLLEPDPYGGPGGAIFYKTDRRISNCNSIKGALSTQSLAKRWVCK
jgi:hypothetical protein